MLFEKISEERMKGIGSRQRDAVMEGIEWFTDAFEIGHTPLVHFGQRFLNGDIDAGQFAGVNRFVRKKCIKGFLRTIVKGKSGFQNSKLDFVP